MVAIAFRSGCRAAIVHGLTVSVHLLGAGAVARSASGLQAVGIWWSDADFRLAHYAQSGRGDGPCQTVILDTWRAHFGIPPLVGGYTGSDSPSAHPSSSITMSWAHGRITDSAFIPERTERCAESAHARPKCRPIADDSI